MKKHTLIVVLSLAFNLGLMSQTYVPFPTLNAKWNVLFASTCDDYAIPDTSLLRYAVHGDTIIDAKLYKKLCLEIGDTLNPSYQTVGALREVNKKIYYQGRGYSGSNLNEEALLYDFNTEIGDTIFHSPYGLYSIVLDIDSVLIDTSYRKRYKVHTTYSFHNPDYIIEGIGSVKNGLLGNITLIPTCGSHYWEHICFKKNGILKYLNPNFNECYPDRLYLGVNNNKVDGNFSVYPNPFDKEFFIEGNATAQQLKLYLMDIEGRVVLEKVITESKSKINLSCNTGMYTLLILNQRGQILQTSKIIKK